MRAFPAIMEWLLFSCGRCWENKVKTWAEATSSLSIQPVLGVRKTTETPAETPAASWDQHQSTPPHKQLLPPTTESVDLQHFGCIKDTHWQSIKAPRHISYPLPPSLPQPHYLSFRTFRCRQSFDSLNPEYVRRDTPIWSSAFVKLPGIFLKIISQNVGFFCGAFADSSPLQCDGAPLWLSLLLHLYVKLSASCWEFNHSNSSQRYTKCLTVGCFLYLWIRNNWIFHVLLHISPRNNQKVKKMSSVGQLNYICLTKKSCSVNMAEMTSLIVKISTKHNCFFTHASIISLMTVVAEASGLLTSPVLVSTWVYRAELKLSTIFQAWIENH